MERIVLFIKPADDSLSQDEKDKFEANRLYDYWKTKSFRCTTITIRNGIKWT